VLRHASDDLATTFVRRSAQGKTFTDRLTELERRQAASDPIQATSPSRLGYRPWQQVYHVGCRGVLDAADGTLDLTPGPEK
jgi:hypothetical protein